MKRKNKEEIEGVHDTTSTLNKQLMAKANFLKQTESFVRKLQFSISW